MKLVPAFSALSLFSLVSATTTVPGHRSESTVIVDVSGGGLSEQDEIIADDAARAISSSSKSLRTAARSLQLSCTLGTGPAIYVSSSTGSDTANDGSSPSTPYATIQHAVNNRSPCSTIYIMGGTYQNELYGQGTHHYKSIVNLSGVSEGLTITNYQNDRPLLQFDGPAAIICQSANPCSHIDISGLEIEGRNAEITFDEAMAHRNSGTTNNRFTGKGVVIWKGNNINLHDMIVHHCPGSGMRVNKGDYITIADSTVFNNCWWSRSAESAIVYAESTSVDTVESTKMIMTGNTVYGNMNKVPYYNPNYAWDYSTIGAGIDCGSYTACDPSCTDEVPCGDPYVDCPWQCRYGKMTQDYIIDGMGVYVTRNKDTYTHGRMELSNNVAYGNGINGLVFHRTDRGMVTGNTIFNNGKVPVLSHPEPVVEDWHAAASGKSRQPYSGLVINNAADVELFGNSVAARYDDDYAFKQQFDSGTTVIPITAGGNNIECRGMVQVDPESIVTTTTDMSVCDTTSAPTCTICTDDPTPWAINNGQDCATWTWAMSNKCSLDSYWVSNSFCQYSCYFNGNGYPGDVCCSDAPTSSPVTSSPTSSPTCMACTDEPTQWMVNNSKDCATWTWGITNNCNINPTWVDAKTCQYSCYGGGMGYSGDECCENVA